MLYFWVLQRFFGRRKENCRKRPRKNVCEFAIISAKCRNIQTYSYMSKSLQTGRLEKKRFVVKIHNFVVEKLEQVVWKKKSHTKQTKKLKCRCIKHYRNKRVCKVLSFLILVSLRSRFFLAGFFSVQ